MKNLRVELTNADLVEIDEYLVKKYNSDTHEETHCLENIDKTKLLEYADTWTSAVIDYDFLRKGSVYYVYTINFGYKLKNRKFELFFRVLNRHKQTEQFFEVRTANADGELKISIPANDNGSSPDIVDIWYRLLIPPTGQYSSVE